MVSFLRKGLEPLMRIFAQFHATLPIHPSGNGFRRPFVSRRARQTLLCKSRNSQNPGSHFLDRASRLSKTALTSALALILLTASLLQSSEAEAALPQKVDTDPLNLDPQVRQAYQLFYILDYERSLSIFEKVQSSHPQDPIATDYVLNTVLFQELFRLDLLDTTFYAHDGFLTGKHNPVTVDPVTADRLNSLARQAVEEADERLKANPKDVNALFARGWARSLDAIYLGMINRSFISALHMALDARRDNEHVLELNPSYVDAKLVVGVHQYVAGSLPLGFKIVAGLAGITGSKSKGMDDLRDAGAHGVITSVEARTALSLFLRREAKYDDAIAVMQSLRDDYPRDFLFELEVANLIKDSGDGPKAIAAYRALLHQAAQPHYFPAAQLELAWFGLAETLRGQRDYSGAAAAYEKAAAEPSTRLELKARCELNAGEMYDLLDQRDRARRKYEVVIAESSDSTPASSAKKYLRNPYNLGADR